MSCYDENTTLGNRWVDSEFRNISIDTCTVTKTVVLIDSLETSGKSVVLAGRYTHPVWGSVSATGYIPYLHPFYSTEANETVRFDSLMLVLSCNTTFVGDTTVLQKYSIHRLTEKVMLNENGYLYNSSSFAYESSPLAVCSFLPRPHSSERIEVRLPDDLGSDLLTRFHNRDESVSAGHFEDYFKGLVIVPDEGQSHSITGFGVTDSLPALELHYHIEDSRENHHKLVFRANKEKQFNRLTQDRRGTPMENHSRENLEIPSSELGYRGVLFSGIGWFTRLEFPHLNNIMEQGRHVEIDRAALRIYPEFGTYSEYNALPDSIFLYIADENNVITDVVKDRLGDLEQTAKLVKDDLFVGNTYYYFDVSEFMKAELGASGRYKHNLQLVLSGEDYTGTLKNLTFGDTDRQSSVVLQLNYKIYESY